MFHKIGLSPIGICYHLVAFLASLVVIAAPGCASAEERYVLAGSAGSARIVMELEGHDEDVRGRYFYQKYRQDIGLSGGWSGAVLTLSARTTGDIMTLRKTRRGYAGTLTTAKARKVPVSLTLGGIRGFGSANVSAAVSGLSDYEQAQLADLAFVPGKTRKNGSRLLRDWREPVSGIEMFRIDGGYARPVIETINASLERRHWEQVSQWFSCEGYDGESGMDISEVRSSYLGDQFVSYAWFASYSCAGTAHPDFGTQGFAFDAKTGRELALEDLLYFGAQPVPAPETTEFYAYRSGVFAPRVVALLSQLYPEEMNTAQGEGGDDECDYSDPSVWNFPSWYLTQDGLYLGAYFARAMRPCDEPDWAVIPWRYLTFRKQETGAAER